MISYNPASLIAPGVSYTRGYRSSFERSLKVVGGIMLTYAWSPIVYRGGVCLAENFISSHWLALEFKVSEQYGLAEVLADFGSYLHVVLATGPSLTVALPWSSPICDANAYRVNLARLTKHYGAEEVCLSLERKIQPAEWLIDLSGEGDKFPIVKRAALKTRKLTKKEAVFLCEHVPVAAREEEAYALGVALGRAGLCFGDARELMLISPTYSVSKIIEPEILEAVWNGLVAQGREYGRFR